METPTLVIVSGSAVTVWDCLKDDEHEHNSSSTVTFYPQGDLKVADICWNHNGQGTKEKNLRPLHVIVLLETHMFSTLTRDI